MEKIYLLLRDNKQSGPHSLAELLSLSLKNTDLIWVEGRSMGWAYPGEIDTLKSFLPEEAKPVLQERNSTKTIEKPPVNDLCIEENNSSIEDKADALRKRAPGNAETGIQLENKYSKSIEEIENEYTSWMISNRKKKSRSPGKKIMIVAVVIIGSITGWQIAGMAFSEKPAAASVKNASSVLTTPDQETITTEPAAIVPGNNISPKKKSTAVIVKEKPSIAQTEIPVEETASPGDIGIISGEVKTEVDPETITETDVSDNSGKSENKKSIKEKISTWLKGGKELNKNSQEEKVWVDISDQLEVKLVKESDDWMMGVRGQKILVANRSNTSLHSALVELYYYSEENALIDKKRMELSGLASGKSKTFGIPDHRLADHVEIRVGEAKGIAE